MIQLQQQQRNVVVVAAINNNINVRLLLLLFYNSLVVVVLLLLVSSSSTTTTTIRTDSIVITTIVTAVTTATPISSPRRTRTEEERYALHQLANDPYRLLIAQLHMASSSSSSSSITDKDSSDNNNNHENDDDDDDDSRSSSSDIGGILWNSISVRIPSSSSSSSSLDNNHQQQQQQQQQDHNRRKDEQQQQQEEQHSHNEHHHHNILIHPNYGGIIPNGQITGLIGPSGSGKSTFLSTFTSIIVSTTDTATTSSSSTSSTTMTSSSNATTTTTTHKALQYDGTVYQYSSSNKNKKNIQLQPIHPKYIAQLQQDDMDTFFDQLSIYETIYFATYMELPFSTKQQRIQITNQTIYQLGLQYIQHNTIGSSSSSSNSNSGGGALRNVPFLSNIVSKFQSKQQQRIHRRRNSGRISGGERRRLSIGLELVSDGTNKQLFIADEPTSGLDSHYSVIVMKLLHTIAITKQIPMICSLHQPRTSIWNLLDNIILMAPGGYICYSGTRENVISYFTNILGYTIPDHMNIAEYLIDLVSITDPENATQVHIDETRIYHLYTTFQQYQLQQYYNVLLELERSSSAANSTGCSQFNISYSATDPTNNRNMVGKKKNPNGKDNNRKGILFVSPIIRCLRRIGALYRRSLRQNMRNVHMNIMRSIISIGNAILLCSVFPTIRGTIPYITSIADRAALLSFAAINLCMMAYMKSITLFTSERPIVHREQVRELYSVMEYLLAKVLSEFPLDVVFSILFTMVLKYGTGLQIQYKHILQVFALITTTGASLGMLLGSVAPTYQHATTAGIPVLVLLMVVGVINPSGVDPNRPQPKVIQYMKLISPFAHAIEALFIGEYSGIKYVASDNGGGFFNRMKNAPKMGGLALISNGDEVLNVLGLRNKTFQGAISHLVLITFGNLMFTWFGLLWKERQNRVRHSTQSSPKQEKQQHDLSTHYTSIPKYNEPLRVPIQRRI